MCYHQPAREISRSKDRFALCGFIRLQRDPEAERWRVSMEWSSWMLCRACRKCCSRRARKVSETYMNVQSKDLSATTTMYPAPASAGTQRLIISWTTRFWLTMRYGGLRCGFEEALHNNGYMGVISDKEAIDIAAWPCPAFRRISISGRPP
jgi:hypothetical protein